MFASFGLLDFALMLTLTFGLDLLLTGLQVDEPSFDLGGRRVVGTAAKPGEALSYRACCRPCAESRFMVMPMKTACL